MSPRSMVDFYAVQFRLLRKWSGGPVALLSRAALALLAGIAALLVTIWLIPGIRVADLRAALITAILLATLTTLARPVLIGLLSAFSVILVGLATILLQIVVFTFLARASTAVVIDGPGTAIIGALTYSFVSTLLTASLSLADDRAFFGTLVRQLAARHHDIGRSDEVGTVFIQIDGLSYPMLERALATGRLTTLSRWVGAMTLTEWEPMLPTQTSASQAGILHGNNDEIPAFRWWDKERKHLLVSNHPADTREMQKRVSNGRGLLADGGASIGNLMSGDAPRSFITAATIKDPGAEIAHSHVQDWFFVSPYSVLRWFLLSLCEVVKELVQSRRSSARAERGLSFALARAVTNVLLRHLNAALVVEEMYRGTPRIYVDFVDYDENAHHAGPESVDAMDAMRGLDRIIGLIEKTAADAPRRYRFVALSDHGQSPGASFKERYGKSLDMLVDELTGEATVHSGIGRAEHWGHLNALASGGPFGGLTTRLLDRPVRGHGRHGAKGDVPDIVVAASGNLGHISFARHQRRVTRFEIDRMHPGLVDALVRHPGLALVMVRTGDEGTVVLGASGSHRLSDGRVTGTDPVAQFGPHAADGLRRIDGMTDCGDIVVISSYDQATGEVAPLEDQIGSHGGLGGPQNRAFILHPREWHTDGAIVGAPAVYEQLVKWLRG